MMNTRRNGWLAFVLAGLVAGIGSVASLKATSTSNWFAEGTAVAVVDWLAVTDQLTAWQEAKARLNDRKAVFQEELTTREGEVRAIRDNLEVLPADSPAYQQEAAKLRQKTVELQAWAQYAEQEMQRDELREQLTVFKRIEEAVKAIAQRDGYMLVLWNDSRNKAVNMRELSDSAQRIATRQIIYANDAIDITDEVAQYLNAPQGGGTGAP